MAFPKKDLFFCRKIRSGRSIRNIRFRLSGGMIYYTEQGKGEDVIIFHGWACDHRYMQPIVDFLSNRYRICNFDLPGRGRSGWDPRIRTIHDLSDTLLPYLPKQAIYIGWSFGGLVCTSIAARHPKRVKRYIGVASSPKFIAGKDWPGVPLPGYKNAFLKVKEVGLETFLRTHFESEFRDIHPKPPMLHELLRLLTNNPKSDLDVLLKGLDIVDAVDLRKEFQAIECPIDLILGEKDENVPTATFKRIKQLNPHAKMHLIPRAHHMPFWTDPIEFNKVLEKILDFLRN